MFVPSLLFSLSSWCQVLRNPDRSLDVAILLVSTQQGGIRCITKTKDNLRYFGSDLTGDFTDTSLTLADLILEKVLEGQRMALDESPSLQLVHDRHCADLAKAIVTTQIVNDKITRLTSLKRFKSLTGNTPLKSLLTSKVDSPHLASANASEKPLVNRVVAQLVHAIELKGLAISDQLYSSLVSADDQVVGATLSFIEATRTELPQDTLQSLSAQELTSVLQHYLKPLCGLLFPITFEQRVEQTAALENPKDMRAKIREAAQNLPHSGFAILRLILEHCDKYVLPCLSPVLFEAYLLILLLF